MKVEMYPMTPPQAQMTPPQAQALVGTHFPVYANG